ncbi:hypothetical protein ADUPG1_013012 [Aduncisulcus paluster]|uniref:C2H2-type domain-containing protein n=1 Tax=Aduncisulcus paluster TaxID=2918883 RepID=A0ABQ5K540_9EUKA|nr:hypothetical protein ADUPG1_013012 [Aduncisulcus paluster]
MWLGGREFFISTKFISELFYSSFLFHVPCQLIRSVASAHHRHYFVVRSDDSTSSNVKSLVIGFKSFEEVQSFERELGHGSYRPYVHSSSSSSRPFIESQYPSTSPHFTAPLLPLYCQYDGCSSSFSLHHTSQAIDHIRYPSYPISHPSPSHPSSSSSSSPFSSPLAFNPTVYPDVLLSASSHQTVCPQNNPIRVTVDDADSTLPALYPGTGTGLPVSGISSIHNYTHGNGFILSGSLTSTPSISPSSSSSSFVIPRHLTMPQAFVDLSSVGLSSVPSTADRSILRISGQGSGYGHQAPRHSLKVQEPHQQPAPLVPSHGMPGLGFSSSSVLQQPPPLPSSSLDVKMMTKQGDIGRVNPMSQSTPFIGTSTPFIGTSTPNLFSSLSDTTDSVHGNAMNNVPTNAIMPELFYDTQTSDRQCASSSIFRTHGVADESLGVSRSEVLIQQHGSISEESPSPEILLPRRSLPREVVYDHHQLSKPNGDGVF